MDENDDIVQYRMLRSEEAVEEAKLLADAGHWNAAMNRLYYAFYYAVSALVHKEGSFAKTHSGLKNQFSQQFIVTNRLDASCGELYSVLFASRQEGDYADFVVFTEAEVMPLIGKVADFVVVAKGLLTT